MSFAFAGQLQEALRPWAPGGKQDEYPADTGQTGRIRKSPFFRL